MTDYITSKRFKKCGHNRGVTALNFLVVFFVFCLLLFYLFQADKMVNYTYQIREQENLISELKVKNIEMESQIAQWRSPTNIENLAQSLGMVATEKAVYLKNERAVAVK